MARRPTRRRQSTARRTTRNYSGPARRATSRRRPPARRSASRARSTAPRQQRIVIEFAGAAPVRDMASGLGLSHKPAPAARLKPRL